MRIVKIPECEYEFFVKIRDVILDHVPFSIINDIYHEKRKTAYFYFWDSDYIPIQLHPFIMQPPANWEPMEEQMKALEKMLGWGPDKEPRGMEQTKREAAHIQGMLAETWLAGMQEKWAAELKEWQRLEDPNMVEMINAFLADLGFKEDEESRLPYPMKAIPDDLKDEAFEKEIKKLPKVMQEKLRQHRKERREGKKDE